MGKRERRRRRKGARSIDRDRGPGGDEQYRPSPAAIQRLADAADHLGADATLQAIALRAANQLDASPEAREVALLVHQHFLEWFEIRYRDMHRMDPGTSRGDALRSLLELHAAGLLDDSFQPTQTGWEDLVDAGLAERVDDPDADPDRPAG